MEKLELFYDKLMIDDALAEKFDKILGDTAIENVNTIQIQQVVELAKEVGIELSAADIRDYIETVNNDSEILTDDQLDMVAAGKDKDNKKFHPLPACFVGDSKVSTPSGAKDISEIKLGDEVISLDESTNKVVAKVIELRPILDKEIIRVEFSNGAVWNTTALQRFYYGRIHGNDDDFIRASDDKGNAALTEDGTKATVIKAEKTGEVQKIYDFVTDGMNIFFVNGIAARGF